MHSFGPVATRSPLVVLLPSYSQPKQPNKKLVCLSSSAFFIRGNPRQNFLPNIRKRQLTQFPTTKQQLISDIQQGERRFRKIIGIFVSFEAGLSEDETKQITEKHVDGKLPAVKLERVTVLAYLVRVEN
jgi:hypothetical protein